MPQFTVHESSAGSAITSGPTYPGVEIALKPPDGALQARRRQKRDQSYVLTPPLASDREIDIAVDRLKERLDERLEAARTAAKQMLKGLSSTSGKD